MKAWGDGGIEKLERLITSDGNVSLCRCLHPNILEIVVWSLAHHPPPSLWRDNFSEVYYVVREESGEQDFTNSTRRLVGKPMVSRHSQLKPCQSWEVLDGLLRICRSVWFSGEEIGSGLGNSDLSLLSATKSVASHSLAPQLPSRVKNGRREWYAGGFDILKGTEI